MQELGRSGYYYRFAASVFTLWYLFGRQLLSIYFLGLQRGVAYPSPQVTAEWDPPVMGWQPTEMRLKTSPSPSAHIVCDSCARETCSSLWWASPDPSLSSREAKAPITLWRLDLIAPVCQLTSLSGLFNECIKHDHIKQPTKSLPQTVGTMNWKQLQSQLLPSSDSPDFNYLRSVIPLIRISSFFFYPFLLITERALPVTCSKIGPEDATSPEVTKQQFREQERE